MHHHPGSAREEPHSDENRVQLRPGDGLGEGRQAPERGSAEARGMCGNKLDQAPSARFGRVGVVSSGAVGGDVNEAAVREHGCLEHGLRAREGSGMQPGDRHGPPNPQAGEPAGLRTLAEVLGGGDVWVCVLLERGAGPDRVSRRIRPTTQGNIWGRVVGAPGLSGYQVPLAATTRRSPQAWYPGF